ncbi:hypothetical protein [Kribbella sp. NPDC051620]|uniref:hypothetical protein n=1 Tax=Kribbella sp. NPDC051620 TaxID=3364120 RepID=UPI0037A82968
MTTVSASHVNEVEIESPRRQPMQNHGGLVTDNYGTPGKSTRGGVHRESMLSRLALPGRAVDRVYQFGVQTSSE